MKCADPVLCYEKKYRHFSLASPIFKQLADLVFNCGKCIFCRKKKSYELAIRCVLHASLYKENSFLTLTYDETDPGYHNHLQYSDIQKFKKSLRRHCDYHFGKKIQIFNVHEYGKNGKKHWHLVVFGHDFSQEKEPLRLFTIRGGNPLYTSPKLSQLWKHGFSTIGSVTEASAMYQAQYTQKDLKNGNSTNQKKSKSNHSGIGKEYFLRHYRQILQLGFIPINSKKVPVPRYFLKLAHKHWSHFNEPDNFRDLSYRKKLYTYFKPGEANEEISQLYETFIKEKREKLEILKSEWDDFIEEHIKTNEKPDFKLAAENYLYDLKNKTTSERF